MTLITLTDSNKTSTGNDASLELAGSISGKVTYSNGNGVVGAKVDAYAIDDPADPIINGWLSGTTVSESDGSYTLGGLPPGVDFKVQFYETR